MQRPTAASFYFLVRDEAPGVPDSSDYWKWLATDASNSRSRAHTVVHFASDLLNEVTLDQVQTMLSLYLRDENEDDEQQFLIAKKLIREQFRLALSFPNLRRILATSPSLFIPGSWRFHNKVLTERGSECGCVMQVRRRTSL